MLRCIWICTRKRTHTHRFFQGTWFQSRHSPDILQRLGSTGSASFLSCLPVPGDRCTVQFCWTTESKKITLFFFFFFLLGCVNHKPSISHLASSWQRLVFMDGIIILRLYDWLFGKKISRLIMPHLLWFPTRLRPFQHDAKTWSQTGIHGSEPKAFKTARKLLSPCYNTMFSQMRPCICGHMRTLF